MNNLILKLGFFLCITLTVIAILQAQQTIGLFQNDSLATEGYVLFGNNEKTYLIDNCGYTINTWESEYKPGLAMYLLENGNLLRPGDANGTFNAGGAGGVFELFSWEGERLWHYTYSDSTFLAHHDLEPLPNGNFLAIVWQRIDEDEAKSKGRIYDGELWSEKIVELEIVGSDQANLVWEWRLWDHLIQDADPGKPDYGIISEHPELININYVDQGGNTSGDWVHLNSITYNESLDQIMVSSRNFNEIWVIDHSTSTAEAASHFGGRYGKGGDLLYRFGNPYAYHRGVAEDQIFFHQHDARWIPSGYLWEGKMLVFNNEDEANASSIEIWTPPVDQNGFYHIEDEVPFGPEIHHWHYGSEHFFSRNMSGAHMLPSGNLFVTESLEGRIFEMTLNRNIVWEYIIPVNKTIGPMAQGDTPRYNDVFRVTKYPVDYPAFIGKNLYSGPPVELDPWEIECDTSKTIIAPPEVTTDFKIIGNPVRESLVVNAAFSKESAKIQLYDLNGRFLLENIMLNGINEIDIKFYPPGMYFARFLIEGEEQIVRKVIKH